MTIDGEELQRIEEKIDRTITALDFTTDALLGHMAETRQEIADLGTSVQTLIEDARADRQTMARIEQRLTELEND